MKKLIFITIALLTVSFVNAQKNVIKINPVGLAFGAAQLSYEYALNDKNALEISMAYSSAKVSFDADEVKANGFGAEGKYKIYFSTTKVAPRGWYAAPVLTYSSASAKSDDSEGKLSVFAAGAVAGYQWIFGGRETGFALDLNLGAQYLSASTSGDISGVAVEGILPRIGLSLGYGF